MAGNIHSSSTRERVCKNWVHLYARAAAVPCSPSFLVDLGFGANKKKSTVSLMTAAKEQMICTTFWPSSMTFGEMRESLWSRERETIKSTILMRAFGLLLNAGRKFCRRKKGNLCKIKFIVSARRICHPQGFFWNLRDFNIQMSKIVSKRTKLPRLLKALFTTTSRKLPFVPTQQHCFRTLMWNRRLNFSLDAQTS